MNKKALSPILSVLGALLLAIVVGAFSASPFGEGEVAHAQTAPELTGLSLALSDASVGALTHDIPTPFDPKKRSYTARVANVNNAIVVNATAEGTVTLNIDGQAVTSGSAITVNLSVGSKVINIRLRENGSSSVYTVRVTRVPSTASSDTKLSSLSLTGVTLSPEFDSGKRTGYTDRVPNSVNLTTVTARAATFGAVVDIRYASADTFNTTAFDTTGSPADAADVVELAETTVRTGGPTTIAIRVRAVDVSTVGYYTVTITRAPVSSDTTNDAKLGTTGLALVEEASSTAISPSPTFNPDKTAYTASVSYDVRSTTVTATAADDGATVTLTSDTDDSIEDTNTESNVFTDQIDLKVGANVITIKVDAEDAIATKTYTVTVTRASATASTDANLSSLSLSSVTLSPAFDPGKTAYRALVPNFVNLTVVTASASDSDALVDIKYAGADTFDTTAFGITGSPADAADVVELAETTAGAGGPTTIAIRVRAANGVATKYYTVTITRAPVSSDTTNDAKLGTTGLALVEEASSTAISPSPTFNPDKTAYTASVSYDVRSTTVTATAADDGATVTLTSDTDDSIEDTNTESNVFTDQIDLKVGANVITIKVDAEDAIATKTYTVTVTRASATASTDANLSSLSLSSVTLSPAFDPGETVYEALVPNSVSTTTVRFGTSDSGALVAIKSTTEDISESTTQAQLATAFNADTSTDADPNNVVVLATGTTSILLRVTAANGLEKKYYKVAVNRVSGNASDNASLNASTFRLATVARPDTAGSPIGPATPNNPDLYLNMPFISTRTAYTTTAARTQSDITLVASPTEPAAIVTVTSDRDDDVKPFDTGSDNTPAYIVDLKHGPNLITIKVTAPDAVSTMTYTVMVTRMGSTDSSLYSLSLSGITLAPAFAAGTTDYMSAETLDTDATMTTVMAMTNHGGASVAISSDRDDDIGDDNVVDLHPGANVITVMVTSEDQSAMTSYMVTINVVASNDATLSSLMLSGVTLMPAFASGTMNYTATVASDVAMTTVTAMPMHPGATVSGTGAVNLAAGDNVIRVTVTAEDGTTSQTYTVTVTVPLTPSSLFEQYDVNDNMVIDKDEALTAIDDYLFHGTITKEQMLDIVDLYLFGTA